MDVVGKYSYLMQSANLSAKMATPVVVDVALVGRTKVLRIHSSLFVKNGTDRKLAFLLRVPDTFLSMQLTPSPGDEMLEPDQGLLLRALAPGEGEAGDS